MHRDTCEDCRAERAALGTRFRGKELGARLCECCRVRAFNRLSHPQPEPHRGSWRMLGSRDRIQAGDQFLEADCQTWTPFRAQDWCVGISYAFTFVPIRRPLP